jgi:hypothetical protein
VVAGGSLPRPLAHSAGHPVHLVFVQGLDGGGLVEPAVLTISTMVLSAHGDAPDQFKITYTTYWI